MTCSTSSGTAPRLSMTAPSASGASGSPRTSAGLRGTYFARRANLDRGVEVGKPVMCMMKENPTRLQPGVTHVVAKHIGCNSPSAKTQRPHMPRQFPNRHVRIPESFLLVADSERFISWVAMGWQASGSKQTNEQYIVLEHVCMHVSWRWPPPLLAPVRFILVRFLGTNEIRTCSPSEAVRPSRLLHGREMPWATSHRDTTDRCTTTTQEPQRHTDTPHHP